MKCTHTVCKCLHKRHRLEGRHVCSCDCRLLKGKRPSTVEIRLDKIELSPTHTHGLAQALYAIFILTATVSHCLRWRAGMRRLVGGRGFGGPVAAICV